MWTRPGVLNGVDKATLQQWLIDAQTTLAEINSGGRVTSLSTEGKSVSYSTADRDNIMVWITMLQQQLGLVPRRRAIRPYF